MTYATLQALVDRQRDPSTAPPWPRDYYSAYLQLREAGLNGPQAQALAEAGYRIIGWANVR